MHRICEPVSTRICIVRHGETDWNLERRIQGHTDIPLNRTGRAQALAMAFFAAPRGFDAIYSSDLTRALETAWVLAQREDQAVTPLPQLRERHFGIFQGLTLIQAAERYPAAYARYRVRDPDYDFETGESLRQLDRRVTEAIEVLTRRHAGQTIAAVSHSGVLDAIYRRATGRPLCAPRDFKIPNCALNWLRCDCRSWSVEAWGERPHLHDSIAEPPE